MTFNTPIRHPQSRRALREALTTRRASLEACLTHPEDPSEKET